MPTEKLKIFISHAWEDKPFVRRVERRLREAGADVWVDHSELRAGQSLPKRISDALGWCSHLLLVWSEKSRDSHWVELEWTNAISLRKEIIPCMLDNTPPPEILAAKIYLSFHNFDQGISQLLLTLNLTGKSTPKTQPSYDELVSDVPQSLLIHDSLTAEREPIALRRKVKLTIKSHRSQSLV